jgi:nitroreductase
VTDFFAVVGRQRACRSFRNDPVDDELIERLLQAASFAPSAENRQPWVFVVVRDAHQRAAVGELGRRAWEGGARQYSEGRLAPTLLADVDHGARGGIAAAPVLVVVCADTSLAHPSSLSASIFPATQNLLLAATAVGLGSAMTTLPLTAGDELSALLQLPPEVVPMAVVPLGWPERVLGPPRRLPVVDKTHRETYANGW